MTDKSLIQQDSEKGVVGRLSSHPLQSTPSNTEEIKTDTRRWRDLPCSLLWKKQYCENGSYDSNPHKISMSFTELK